MMSANSPVNLRRPDTVTVKGELRNKIDGVFPDG